MKGPLSRPRRARKSAGSAPPAAGWRCFPPGTGRCRAHGPAATVTGRFQVAKLEKQSLEPLDLWTLLFKFICQLSGTRGPGQLSAHEAHAGRASCQPGSAGPRGASCVVPSELPAVGLGQLPPPAGLAIGIFPRIDRNFRTATPKRYLKG